MVKKTPAKNEDQTKRKDFAFATGKRRRAIARASIKPGRGIVKINTYPIETLKNSFVRMKISEPLILAGEDWKKFDISVRTGGGGILGQADAARLAIAKCLCALLGPELRSKYMEYDRNMLIADPRRTEPHKPPRSSQGPRRAKQKSKR
jgi:small subunit ribosomal protein S9